MSYASAQRANSVGATHPRPLRLPAQGPFLGMRDSLDPAAGDPRLAVQLYNVFPISAATGAAWIGRPGSRKLGSQMGATGVRYGHKSYQFTKLDGTEYTLFFVGGKMYTADWGADTVTEVALGVGCVLPTTGRVFCDTFTNQLVVNPSNGVDRPWMWDGTSFTLLTNAPIAFGPPTIYYGKMFWMKYAARNTIEWSEENQPNLGYSALANTWEVTMTEQEGFFAMVGTNEYLALLRAESSTAISGAVTTNFRSAATREAISEFVGTKSPAATLFHRGRIWTLDTEGKVHILAPGIGELPVWQDYYETLRGLDRNGFADAVAVYDDTTGFVLFGLMEAGQSTYSLMLVFDPRPAVPQFVGIWDGFTFDALDMVKDGDGRPVLVHLSADGYAYYHGRADNQIADDELVAGTQAIRHRIESSAIGLSVQGEKVWDRLDFNFRAASQLSGMRLWTTTPHGQSAALTLATLGDGSGISLWDTAEWDSGEWGANAVDLHTAVGISAHGRWLRWTLLHEAEGELFGFAMAEATAYPIGNMPGVP